MLYRSTAPRVRTFSQVLNFRNDMERLESRVFFDAGYTMDPDLVASLNSPRQRNPGAGISVDASSDPGTNAPPVLGTIEGVNFNGDATASGFYHIPPDIIGTAGPNHVLNAVNTTIQWFTKAGTNQLTQRLGKNGSTAVGSFFASLAPVDGLFDPKVLYDQYSNRFVVVALEMQDTAVGDPINSSRLLIAASDDSDPNGTWYFQAIDTKLNIAGTDTWLDYPGLAVDSGAMYITGNMFNFGASTFRGSRLWLLDKAGLYAGGTSAFNMYDPSTLAGGIPGGQVFTPQPAHMFGSAPGTVGTFLVSSGFAFGSNEAISVIRIDNPLSSPTFTGTFIDVGNISSTYNPPTSSQLGTAQTVDSGDARVMNAVWRNNFLYFGNIVSPVAGADTGTATAHWYKFNATNVTTSLADQGNIGAEDIAAGTRTYYPAVAVDSANNLAIGFAASGPSIYPGAYYTGRLAGDAAGTVQTTGTLAAGLDFYNRRFGGSRNRWGDYSGLALDPADGSTFWVYNQYALARGNIFGAYPTEDGRWGTRWGKFSLAALSGGINGIVYEDRDGSSTYGGSDTVMLGVTVYLDANNNGSLDGGESSTTSTGTGYSFTGLAPGSYNVREVVPAGYILTEPVSGIHVLVVAAATLSANFGNFPYVFTGTAGNDSYYVRASGGNAQIWVGAVPPTTPTYSIAKSMLPSLSFNAQAGDDTLVLDHSLGDPTPAGGIAFAGGAQTTTAGDVLDVRGAGLADVFSLVAAGIITHVGNSTSYSAAETLKLIAGTYNVSFDLAALNLETTGGTSKVNLTWSQNLASLTIGSGANVTSTSSNGAAPALIVTAVAVNSGTLMVSPSGNLSGVSRFKSLTITGTGAMDLRNNDLVVDYTGSGTPFTSILNYVKTGIPLLGFGGTGVGIASTEVQNQTISGTMVGVIDGATTGGLVSVVSGYILPNPQTSVLVKYTWRGDTNLTQSIDGSDYALADTGFTGGGTGWFYGDVNYDGVINGSDYALIDTGFSSQSTGF